MPEPFLIFELIGTVAFALSGAMTGLHKNMDLFGVAVLGLITATGGGVIRDLVLGVTPPVTFRNPLYALVAIATALLLFIPALGRRLGSSSGKVYNAILLWMDSLGLGAFTVSGIQSAHALGQDFGLFLYLFVGVVTGVGGGVLRDALCGNTPYIFVKHVYASASLLGAAACALLWEPLGATAAMAVGAALVLAIRLLAARFRWSLPHPPAAYPAKEKTNGETPAPDGKSAAS